MFVINVNYTADLAIIDSYLLQHRDWLDQHLQQGIFLFAGAQVPRSGGIIIAAGLPRSEVEELIQSDPFYVHGVAKYSIIEFTAAKALPELNRFVGQ